MTEQITVPVAVAEQNNEDTVTKEEFERVQKELKQAQYTLMQQRVANKTSTSVDTDTSSDFASRAELYELTESLRKSKAADIARSLASGDVDLQTSIYNAYLNDVRTTDDVDGDVNKAYRMVAGARVQSQASEQVRSALSQRMVNSAPAPAAPIMPVQQKVVLSPLEDALVKQFGIAKQLGLE